MVVTRCTMAAALLSCEGDKCRITTKAMPGRAGICSKSRIKASSPPADAPRPTTGKFSDRDAGTGTTPSVESGVEADLETMKPLLRPRAATYKNFIVNRLLSEGLACCVRRYADVPSDGGGRHRKWLYRDAWQCCRLQFRRRNIGG